MQNTTKNIKTPLWDATISDDSVYNAHGDWDSGVWYNGRWLNGSWFGGIWLDGFHDLGAWFKGENSIWVNGKWLNGIWQYRYKDKKFIAVSPKAHCKPKLTLSLNYAKYKQ